MKRFSHPIAAVIACLAGFGFGCVGTDDATVDPPVAAVPAEGTVASAITLYDEAGQPVAGRVCDDLTETCVDIGGDGWATLDLLAGEPAEVVAYADGFSPHRIGLAGDASSVTNVTMRSNAWLAAEALLQGVDLRPDEGLLVVQLRGDAAGVGLAVSCEHADAFYLDELGRLDPHADETSGNGTMVVFGLDEGFVGVGVAPLDPTTTRCTSTHGGYGGAVANVHAGEVTWVELHCASDAPVPPAT